MVFWKDLHAFFRQNIVSMKEMTAVQTEGPGCPSEDI